MNTAKWIDGIDSHISRKIGPTIRIIRKWQWLTLEQLSNISGVSLTYIAAIERWDKPNMTISILDAICNSLKVPLTIVFLLANTQEDIEKLMIYSPSIPQVSKDIIDVLYHGQDSE